MSSSTSPTSAVAGTRAVEALVKLNISYRACYTDLSDVSPQPCNMVMEEKREMWSTRAERGMASLDVHLFRAVN